jgi:signal transduction histidine kinase
VVLIIEDNGRGFVPEDKNPAGRELGLAGIRERAKLMNGAVDMESADGKGTTLFARIPMQFAADDGNPNP